MQFVPNGPDIPLSLLRAHREGNVVFVVGAGVSRSVDLPLFGRLIDDVYTALGQALPGEPDSLATRAEEQARKDGQYDRLAGLLEQRLVYRGANWRQPNNVVRDAVAARLKAPARKRLGAHLDLLDLSRGRDGRPRVITTNFDTLFERAWKRAHDESIESTAGPAMPQVGSYEFTGILHLHGRIEDTYLGLDRTDLVLSSPNFGEAYMRNGWASRVVYDLLRRYTLVLVGYAADDPPMRYMLEATEDGRLNFPDLKPAFALAGDEHGNPGALREAWAGKGLQPLIFPAVGGDFSPLYKTLRAWADMARDPLARSRAELGAVAAIRFEDSSEADREKFAYLTQEVSSVNVATEVAQDPAWINALQPPSGNLDWRTYHSWFRNRLESQETVRLALEMGSDARMEMARAVEFHLRVTPDPLAELYARFWVLFVQAHLNATPDTIGRIRQGAVALTVRIRDLTSRVEPRLRIDPPFRLWDDERKEQPSNIHDLAHFHFQTIDRDWQRILERWPTNAVEEERLILSLDRSLCEACEVARDAVLMDVDGDLMSTDLAMVHAPEPGEGLVEPGDHHGKSWRMNLPDTFNDRFAPNIRLMTGLWRRLAGHDAPRATRIAQSWVARDEVIFKRLAAWAASISSAGPIDEMIAHLATTTRDRFWYSDLNVEFARFYCHRWNDLPPAVRRRIENAILEGYRVERIRTIAGRGNTLYAKALYTVRELARIVTAGGRLSSSTTAALEKLYARYPRLPREIPLLAHLYSPSWSGSGYSADIRALDDVPDDRLIDTASALEASNRIDQADVWPVFVRSEPARAFRALVERLSRGDFPPSRWQAFLGLYGYRPDELTEDTPPLADVIDVIAQAPAGQLGDLSYQLASIIERNAEKTAEHIFPRILQLWDILLPVAAAVEDADIETPLAKAVPGSALATLATSLMSMQSNLKREENGGFVPELAPRFDSLVVLNGRSGLVAKGALMTEIAFLDWLSPDWVGERLMSVLTEDNLEAVDMMSIVASSAALRYDRLFNKLKTAILRTLEHERTDDNVREYLTGALVGAAFDVIQGNSEFDLTAVECRRTMTRMPARVLSRMAWELGSELRGKKTAGERAAHWQTVIEPFLHQFWPNDVAVRTDEVSANLVRLPGLAGEAFERAVDVVLDLVRPISRVEFGFGLGIDDDGDGDDDDDLVRRFPRAAVLLISSVLDTDGVPPYGLDRTIQKLMEVDPQIVSMPAFWRLRSMQRPS